MLLQGLRVREGNVARSADMLLRTCGRGGQEWRAAIINLWLTAEFVARDCVRHSVRSERCTDAAQEATV